MWSNVTIRSSVSIKTLQVWDKDGINDNLQKGLKDASLQDRNISKQNSD